MLLNGMGGVTLNNGTTLKHSEKYWFFISDDSDFFLMLAFNVFMRYWVLQRIVKNILFMTSYNCLVTHVCVLVSSSILRKAVLKRMILVLIQIGME